MLHLCFTHLALHHHVMYPFGDVNLTVKIQESLNQSIAAMVKCPLICLNVKFDYSAFV